LLAALTRRRSEGGFTLIELLAVIVIMALIAAIGFPALRALSGTALQSAARQFSSAMILARQYAINNRTPVRVTLAVNLPGMGVTGSNLICRAYNIYWASNDLNGATVAWWPLQDWRMLPTGVIFSDHNATSYNWVTLDEVPPAGSQTRTLGSGTPAWQYFNNSILMPLVTNVAVAGVATNITTSYIEFRPTGAAVVSTANGVAGVRLATGSVTAPATRTVVINNTNTWAYVEYDNRNGRVRVRYPESYQ
jgi:prepilin-type N-terminal cleavage/methylation domain-containing protein